MVVITGSHAVYMSSLSLRIPRSGGYSDGHSWSRFWSTVISYNATRVYFSQANGHLDLDTTDAFTSPKDLRHFRLSRVVKGCTFEPFQRTSVGWTLRRPLSLQSSTPSTDPICRDLSLRYTQDARFPDSLSGLYLRDSQLSFQPFTMA